MDTLFEFVFQYGRIFIFPAIAIVIFYSLILNSTKGAKNKQPGVSPWLRR